MANVQDVQDQNEIYDEHELFVTPIEKIKAGAPSITKLTEPLSENNWIAWRERMKRVFRYCRVEEYITGTIYRPEEDEDVVGAKSWDYNDNYAQMMIVNNITSSEMVHIGQCANAKAMWDNLEAVHESKGHQTIVSVIWNLFHTHASEDDNISNHLNKLKEYWECINTMNDKDFMISDPLFKVIISSSLPLFWDAFTESYIGGCKDVIETDPKKLIKSQGFIGILKEEYIQCKARVLNDESVNQASGSNKKPLANRISSNNEEKCKQCGCCNHATKDCHHLGKSKCNGCGKFGHVMKDCWGNKNSKNTNSKNTHMKRKYDDKGRVM